MKRRSSQRGFTLIELLVASSIGAGITLAGVAFVAHQTRLMGFTNERIEMNQSSRFGIERLRADLRMAGAGIGYDESGGYSGLEVGSFQRGGATFTSNNRALHNGKLTDDLGLLLATGGQATIAGFNSGGIAQFCTGSGIKAGTVVILRSEDGLSARSVQVDSIQRGGCSGDICTGGCDDVHWSADPDNLFSSGPGALDASYLGGTATGDLRRVTWFVDDTDPAVPGQASLRRAEGNCGTLDYTCGDLVARRVESLQLRRYLRNGAVWDDVTDDATPTQAGGRIRVDIELIVKGRIEHEAPGSPSESLLEAGQCFPSCTDGDGYARKTMRASVEIKNSGRNQYWRGR